MVSNRSPDMFGRRHIQKENVPLSLFDATNTKFNELFIRTGANGATENMKFQLEDEKKS